MQILHVFGLCAMASLPLEFEETPINFSAEAIRLSEAFQQEPGLKRDSCLMLQPTSCGELL